MVNLNEPFILCDNLVKIHKVAELEVVALQGLDLVVGKGELMGVIGPSGSGKTTLMNILGGLDRPSAGRVWVDGRDLLKMNAVELDRYRCMQVGFVWQQSSRNLISYLNAQDNVEYPMIIAGISWKERKKRAQMLLEMVGISERRKAKLGQFSGGEQQRVAIAVALANQPKLLLADEPTGEVDTNTAQKIYQAFRDINQELGLTTLIVSHDPEIARQVNRVVSIRDGKTATETVRQSRKVSPQTEDVKSDEHKEEEFLELTVLDSAGRLQLPKDYLKQLGIKGRVRLELTEEGIYIRPAPHADHHDHTVDNLITQLEQSRKRGWLHRLLEKLPGRKEQ